MTISLSMYCRCGSYMCGSATPEEADSLMQAFAGLHSGDGHEPFHPDRVDEAMLALVGPYLGFGHDDITRN